MSDWIAVIAGALTLITLVVKYFFSDEAEQRRLTDLASSFEKKRKEESDAIVLLENAQASAFSKGLGNAWDAADQKD